MDHRPLVALLLMLTALPGFAADALVIPESVEQVLEQRYPRDARQLLLIQQQVQRVAQLAMPATVGITVGGGAGSGVVVSADGLVLTAGHVIGRAGRRAAVLLPDGRRLFGKTLGANHEIDAGMIQLTNPPSDLPFLPIAKTPASVGQWVITLGQPGGATRDRSPPLRLGRVLGGGDDWVCTDCTLVGGDSGGPLVNLRGEVLAVHSSIGSEIVHNFHIPVVEIQNSWDRLLAGEVWGSELEPVVSSKLRPIMGIAGHSNAGHCLITEVFHGLPADEAGMRTGDVVVAVDGDAIATFDELAARVRRKRPGQKMQLKIDRAGQTISLEVTLAGLGRSAPRGPRGDGESQEQP